MLDQIYPSHCLICERGGEPVICERCFAGFLPLPEPICAVCGQSLEPTEKCRACGYAEKEGGWGFDRARAASIYEGTLRYAIQGLKYRRCEELGLPLGAYLANRCVAEELFPSGELKGLDAVVPVPLHPTKRRVRGFSQTESLARPLVEMLGVPLATNLVRRAQATKAQVELSGAERRRNMRENSVFAVTDAGAVKGKQFLLVDDVLTTGATVSACAHTLRRAGAARILVVTLATGG